MSEDIDLKHKIKSREIVKEILDYGVNQIELIQIIKLLSLELEDSEKMKKIVNLISENNTIEIKPKLQI